MKPNMDLRFYAKGHGVTLWQIAKQYGVSEPTIIRRLRVPFNAEQKAEFRAAVEKLAQQEVTQ